MRTATAAAAEVMRREVTTTTARIVIGDVVYGAFPDMLSTLICKYLLYYRERILWLKSKNNFTALSKTLSRMETRRIGMQVNEMSM
jgi:hypothetical protein